MQRKQVAGVILAGGQSRRMGQAKALLPYRGAPLIDHLIQAFSPQVGQLLVAGSPSAEGFAHLNIPVLADLHPDRGPLGGIHSAMHYLLQPDQSPPNQSPPNQTQQGATGSAGDVSALITIPCDGVELPQDFVAQLCDELGDHELVFARDNLREQHLYCLMKIDLIDSLESYLAAGNRRVIDWLTSHRYAVVDFSRDDFTFSNFNTPHDWQQFLSR